jgi:hypothetical protein
MCIQLPLQYNEFTITTMEVTMENITRTALTMEDIAPIPIPREQLLHSRYQCTFIFVLLGLTYTLWYTREVVEAGRWFIRQNTLEVEAFRDEVDDLPEAGDFWEGLGMVVAAIDLFWWRLWWLDLEIYDVLLHIIRLRLILKSPPLNIDSFIRVHIPLSDTELDFLFIVLFYWVFPRVADKVEALLSKDDPKDEANDEVKDETEDKPEED